MTATSLLPVLDVQTIQELQPPCELCTGIAEWVMRFHCTGCGRNPVVLICTEHKAVALTFFVRAATDKRCAGRFPVVLDSIEPVRRISGDNTQ